MFKKAFKSFYPLNFLKINFIKIFLFTFIFLIYFILFSSKIYAQDEFDTSYSLTYQVNADASVTVVQTINLINKLTNIYAKSYQITLGSTRVRGVWAKDSSGDLSPQVVKKENLTQINLDFNEKIVGKGNTLSFSLGYISDDYAMKNGRVLEIGIPKMAEAEKLTDYNVKLIVPYLFEDPAYVFPHPIKIEDSSAGKIYYYNKQNLINQSINAAFGNYQVFDFNIKYYLENDYNNNSKHEISLPPDTAFQKVYLQTLYPEPESTIIDDDGNWLAYYILEPEQRIEIVATGSAEIYMNPREDYPFKDVINKQDYLKEQKYWPVNDQQIKEIASTLTSPKQIYDYVVDSLLYDYSRINLQLKRGGALAALNNKASAICMEFTDLFIALARSAGIPAREANGFAYTNNPQLRPLSLKQDILHAWPQYYDNKQQLWISIDPTWGNTTGGVDFFNKLDLNHFAFVFHGLDSQLPLAAGSYKSSDNQEKIVNVKFGEKPLERVVIEAQLNFQENILAGLPLEGNIIIENKGNLALHDIKVVLDLSQLGLKDQSFKIKTLVPLSSFEKKVVIEGIKHSLKGNKTISLKIKGNQFSQKVNFKSYLYSKAPKLIKRIYSWLLLIFSKLLKIKVLF